MDAYRSAEGRDVVQRWCADTLAAWDVPHGTELLDVEVAGEAVATHVTRVGDGPPRFVWLPGTALSTSCSLDAVAALASRGSVWALDLPGQPGLSQPRRPRRDTTTWYSAWLEAVLDQTGGRELVLVGSGLGGAIALSADRPTVASRFLVSPGGLLPVTLTGSLVRDHTRWSLHASPSSARPLGQHLVGPGRPVPEWLVEWLTMVGRACRTIRFPRSLPQHYLDRIDGTPLTVVVGEDDLIAPPAALSTSMARRTSATVVVVDGAGHLLPQDRWERVLRILAD